MRSIFLKLLAGAACALAAVPTPCPADDDGHAELVGLFEDYVAWRRAGETGDLAAAVQRHGADALAERAEALARLRARFDALDPLDWTVPERVDFLAARSRLDAAEFRLKVSRPWARDPGFYVDPLMRIAFTELPTEAAALEQRLAAVGDWLALARENLVDGAADYANLALRNLTRHDGVGHGHPYRAEPPAGVIGWYRDLAGRAQESQPDLVGPIEAALAEIESFESWLREAREDMDAPAGVGREAFDWYLRQVKLMPYTADEVVGLAERELDRLRAFLALEEIRNRHLPKLTLPDDGSAYRERVERVDAAIRAFLRDTDFITIPDYIPEDFETMGFNVPWIERPGGPNYWEQIQYRNPAPDHWHAVIPGHRFDSMVAARLEHPIRRHIDDAGRIEGWAMYLEEIPLQLGFYDQRPRVRELIYNFGIFRAVRTIGDVKLQRNEMTASEAAEFWKRYTPYLDDDVARVDAEIYLRRPPGYGISYTVGAFQLQELLADRREQLGDAFDLGDFHDRLMAAGRLPISLLRWEITGRDDEVQRLWDHRPLDDVLAGGNAERSDQR
jgi:hypothetical protein